MTAGETWLPGVLALGLSLLVTRTAEAVAPRLGIVARPAADRWHRRIVPLLGGVGIAVGTLVPAALYGWSSRRVVVLLALALGAAILGLIDDVRGLSPRTKLIGQIVLAVLLSRFGFVLRLTGSEAVDLVITVFWIVGITNAFNLLDNIDGLASAVALVAASFRLLFFAWEGGAVGMVASAALMGATTGFLIRNAPPARIFMGDTGSLFLGFFLAALCLLDADRAYSRGMAAVLVVPVLTLLVPIFDTTFVTLTRLLAGRNPAVGGRDHTSHRLIAAGLSERRTVVVMAGLSAASGLAAVASYALGLAQAVVLLGTVLLGFALLGIHLGRVGHDPGRAGETPPASRSLDLPYARELLSVLLDVGLIVLAYYAAYVIRFESALPLHRDQLYGALPIVIAVQLPALAAAGLYRGVWRYTSVADALRVVQAATAGVVLTVVALVYLHRFEAFSRMVFVLDWLLLIALVLGTRASSRLFDELLRASPPSFARVLVYGAGAGGELIVREMLNNPELRRIPIGFIDDDRRKHRARIHGLAVLGAPDQLEAIVSQRGVTEVVVSSHKISGAPYEALAQACRRLGVPVRRASIRFE